MENNLTKAEALQAMQAGMRDIRGAGGNIYRGVRTVRKGGFLRFDGSLFQSNDLLAYVGDRVHVYNNGASPFASGPIIVSTDFYNGRNEICTIKESEYLKSKRHY